MLPSGAPLRTRLESGFAGRALSLPAPSHTALLITALDGDRLEHRSEEAQPTSLSPRDLLEIERLGLITRDSTPSGVRFRHPLVRSAIINTASPDEVRAAHAVLAEQHRADPERRVWHLAAAAVEPKEEVAAEIEQTAYAVSVRGGTGLAVTAMQRAAALTPTPATPPGGCRGPPTWPVSAAGSTWHSGSSTRPAGTWTTRPAPRTASPPRRGSCCCATATWRPSAAADPGRRHRRRLHDRSRTGWSRPGSRRGRLVRAGPRRVGSRAGRVRGRGDHLGPHVHLLHDVLYDVSRTGHGAATRLRAAFEALPDDAPPGRVAELCRAATWLDLLHDYRLQVRDLIADESGRGAVTYAASGYWFAAHDHYLSGEWEAAETAASAGLDLCVRHDLELLAHDLRCSLGWFAAGRGDVDSAREYSRTVEQWAEPRGSGLHLTLSARNLALAALSQGDYESAYAQCVRVSPAGDLARHVAYAPWLVFDLVDAAVHSGSSRGRPGRTSPRPSAPRWPTSPPAAPADLRRPGPGRPRGRGAALFRAALALPRVEQRPFDHARVRLALGEFHRRRHRPGDARPELRRAADLFARIGATAWRQRAEQELRATGVAVAQQVVPRTSTDSAAGDLTAQQLEVAHLAASGLSNKEIAERLYLSPRTVSAHLYRIFPKLGITSRSALRDALEALRHTRIPS
ncbi:response regulator transcription factor [Streptosporangium lutulentum]